VRFHSTCSACPAQPGVSVFSSEMPPRFLLKLFEYGILVTKRPPACRLVVGASWLVRLMLHWAPTKPSLQQSALCAQSQMLRLGPLQRDDIFGEGMALTNSNTRS
jgi:hypothetical protein